MLGTLPLSGVRHSAVRLSTTAQFLHTGCEWGHLENAVFVKADDITGKHDSPVMYL